MAAPQAESRRKSYILSLEPVQYSLTAGTSIPTPSPPHSPVDLSLDQTRSISRPPTAGGGPLNSHPTNDGSMRSMPGAFPPTPEAEKENHADNSMSSDTNADPADSVRSPTSPASTKNQEASSPARRRPSGVRRLFSLTNLRQSFSSSRTSLSVRPGSSYGSHQDFDREQAPSIYSTTPSAMPPPSMHSSKPPNNTLRKKRSSNWFKRQSGFFTMNDDDMLDVVSEDTRPDTRETKRLKESSPMPMLPEISTLSGGNLSGEGSLGWDEQLFKR